MNLKVERNRGGLLFLMTLFVAMSVSFDPPHASRALHSSLTIEWRDAHDHKISSNKGHLRYSQSPFPGLPPAEDGARFRIVIKGAPRHPSPRITLLSVAPKTKKVRHRLNLPLRDQDNFPGQRDTPWLVLVTDRNDCLTTSRHNKAIYARPGDIIKAELRLGGSRPVYSFMSIGVSDTGSTDFKTMSLKVQATVLKKKSDGAPIIGKSESETRAIIEHQIDVLRDVLAQCYIEVDWTPDNLQIVYPPQSCMIAIGDRYGLPSTGGVIRLEVDNLTLPLFEIQPAQTPAKTAQLLKKELEQIGFQPSLTINRKPPTFAFASADIVVRRTDGKLAEIRPWPGESLTTSQQQTVHIGSVTTAFGLDSYDQNTSAAGTLEERTLVKCLTEPDEKMVNIFVVGALGDPSRQGESFIRTSTPPMANTVIIDKQALIGARQSYTLSHEIGHVLLGDLGHPDTRGDGRSFLLMHSHASSAVGGPAHLTAKQCVKIREESKDLLY